MTSQSPQTTANLPGALQPCTPGIPLRTRLHRDVHTVGGTPNCNLMPQRQFPNVRPLWPVTAAETMQTPQLSKNNQTIHHFCPPCPAVYSVSRGCYFVFCCVTGSRQHGKTALAEPDPAFDPVVKRGLGYIAHSSRFADSVANSSSSVRCFHLSSNIQKKILSW
jgi:hypothetical protein